MFSINHNNETNILKIENADQSVYAKIYLDAGASLQVLTLDGKAIIKDLHPLVYANTYASSILFPFANRVKDGAYTFNNETYQLETNQKEERNALHGLVYNKSFALVDRVVNNESLSIKFDYTETELSQGFPYKYSIQLEYVFTKTSLALNVSVANNDSNTFPFTLGWHPYFVSDNLDKSNLSFSSTKKLVLGDRNITTGVEKINDVSVLDLNGKQLDDCWFLNSNLVEFNTPGYKFTLESTENDSFLQAYTPPKPNVIAIEPTTGVSDSFNNKIGLKVLNPKETHNISWRLKIK